MSKQETLKISNVKIENVKRIRAVNFQPNEIGITVIGGRNGQGKTSVLESIAWALGGNKFKPDSAGHDGETPVLRLEMSNGLIVERSGARHALKVTDREGTKSGQALLDTFIAELALNLPAFMNATTKEKASTLLKVIGVEAELAEIDAREKELFDERRMVNRESKSAAEHASNLAYHHDAGEAVVSLSELSERLRAAHSQNSTANETSRECAFLTRRVVAASDTVKQLEQQLEAAKREHAAHVSNLAKKREALEQMAVVDTSALEQSISDAEAMNAKVAANKHKAEAEAKAAALSDASEKLTEQIESARAERMALLSSAKLPLEGLSVDGGELTYRGHTWDGMSGSEQLRVASAIVRSLNPSCGFVLVDKLEQMDPQTLSEFSAWAISEGLQIIATRVSVGDECSFVLEDGTIPLAKGVTE